MSDVRTLHEAAMEHADRGARLRAEGKPHGAREAMRDAYIAEERAAMLLHDRLDAEPSRSVLFRSAATLALEAGEFGAALRLARMGMAGSPPQDVLDELRSVVHATRFVEPSGAP